MRNFLRGAQKERNPAFLSTRNLHEFLEMNPCVHVSIKPIAKPQKIVKGIFSGHFPGMGGLT
jgi:hypothetical protein